MHYIDSKDGFGMGRLSAYCVETGDVMSVERI